MQARRGLLGGLCDICDTQLDLGAALVVVEAEHARNVEFSVVSGSQQRIADGCRGSAESDGLEPGAVVGGELEADMAGSAHDFSELRLVRGEGEDRLRIA